jgi:hypothetical protein
MRSNGYERSGDRDSKQAKQPTYLVQFDFDFIFTEVAEEHKTLEIMRKFSEQYAKRYVGDLLDGLLLGERSK